MAQVPMEELLKRCRSVYKLVTVAAKRAKELAAGAPKLVDGEFKKITTVALEEIRQGKIVYHPSEEEGAVGESRGKGRARERAHATAGKRKKS